MQSYLYTIPGSYNWVYTCSNAVIKFEYYYLE